jgi:VWFA-related protein
MSIRNLIVGVLVAGLCMQQGLMAQGPVKLPEPAKSPEPQVDPNDLIFRQQNIFVMAPVIVHDLQGNIVNGLSPLDFELYDNGKLQKITEDATSHPISMVVAVQSSANMQKLLPDIQKIGSLFTGLVLGVDGEMAVLSFDHRIQTMTEFTSDPDKISAAFKNIKIGSTPNHVNDAAMKGVNMLRTRDKARRRILLLISETRDSGSSMGVRDVLTEAEFKDITVYAVEVSHLLTSLTSQHEPPRPNAIPPEARHLGGGAIGTQTTDAQQNMGDYSPIIKEIFTAVKAIFISNPQEVYTKYTGGREYSYMTQKGLQKAIADIGDEIHSQYLLTYLPNNTDEAGYHEIVVKVLKPNLRVTTRPGYWTAAKF